MDLSNPVVTKRMLSYFKRKVQTLLDKKADTTVTDDLQFQLDGLGEPYRLKDFSQSFSPALTIPVVTKEVANTAIPNVDITISGKEATDFAIAGLLKYECYNGSSRINAFPVCTFSMSGQTALRVRMMAGGTDDKTMTKIQGAILLKHR